MCEKVKFHSKAPMLKYCQKSLNSFCLSSLVSDFSSFKQTKDANTTSKRIKEYFKSEVGNRIYIQILFIKSKNKGEKKSVLQPEEIIKRWALLIL